MKRILTTALLLGAVALVPTVTFAQTSTNWSQPRNLPRGISGSVHDFTANQNYWLAGATNTWVQYNNLCGVCHTMHHAGDPAVAPLWTHNTTTTAFTPYTSPTMAVTPGQPGYSSMACLSCHDGSVAVNDTGGKVQGGTGVYINAGNTALIAPSGDLTHTHPVGFSYVTAQAAQSDELNPVTTVVFNSGGKNIQNFMLFNGNMECATCHDIHRVKGNSMNSGVMSKVGGTGARPSELCLTCHIK